MFEGGPRVHHLARAQFHRWRLRSEVPDAGAHEANLFDLDSEYADVVDVVSACRRPGDP